MERSNFYWNEACSICFEARCDFNFPACQDQFCTNCIERYLNEVIINSWGLPVCSIKCPVCYDVIPKHIWSKYVSRDMLARYERYNQPFRPFARFCNGCGSEKNPTPIPSLSQDAYAQAYDSIVSTLGDKLCVNDDVKESFHKGFHDLEQGKSSVSDLFELMISLLTDLPSLNLSSDGGSSSGNVSKPLDVSSSRESLVIRMSGGQPEKRRRTSHPCDEVYIASIMATVVALERSPEFWRKLQYTYVKTFPKTKCNDCGLAMCLQCGECDWHEGLSCEEYFAQLLEQSTLNDDTRATLKWKLTNSKRCPSCSVVINRDDGCNKVDCLHCGFEFCWVCLRPWSKLCGFFRCVLEPSTTNENESTTNISKHHHSDKPEIGVPNVAIIQKKLSSIIEQRENESSRNSTEIQTSTTVQAPTPAKLPSLHWPLLKDWLLGASAERETIF